MRGEFLEETKLEVKEESEAWNPDDNADEDVNKERKHTHRLLEELFFTATKACWANLSFLKTLIFF